MSLFAELKRRNVIRVGIAYMVASWLLMQMVDVMAPILDLPDWAPKLIFLILAVGFIPVIIFSWAFELTPEGIKREAEVNRSQSITNATARKLDLLTIGLVIGAVLIVALDRFLPQEMGSEPFSSTDSVAVEGTPAEKRDLTPLPPEASETATQPTAKSIAVLPFVNMSSDPEQEYFSDGIAEEILNSLARVKDLKVAGRTSSFAFKGENQDLRQIGGILGVENILEGSVRKSGNTVRITAQLIQVDDGFHLWSDTYDRELNDVFAIQDEIASAILQQLKAHLLDEEQSTVVAKRVDTHAYDLYLLANQRIYERTRPALESAAELLDRAIALDSGFAAAYAQRGIANLLLSDRDYGTIPLDQASAQAKLYIDQALRLDPKQVEALSALGLYHMKRPGETDQAISTLEAALALNPNQVNASNWLQSAYADAGRFSEMMEILEDLKVRDPLYRPGIANLNGIYLAQNRLEEARAQIETIKPFMPNDPFLLRLEASVLYATGDIAQGLTIAETALAIQPDNFPNKGLVGRGLDATGQFERLAEEGTEGQRWFALIQLGRMEEATSIARKLASTGEDPGALIGLLANYGQQEEAVKFIEQRWADLDAYMAENPSMGGGGIATMLDIAYAYASVGNEARFEDAMKRSRKGLDDLAELGFKNNFLLFLDAVYHTLSGDHQAAIAIIGTAVDEGFVSGAKLSEGWNALSVLEGDPGYEAIQQRMFDHLNAERAQLGLEPLST